MIINIILAVLVLSIVVIVHEFGHFILAKANGVTVVEFSLGFGPKLLHFKKGETEYCLKLIPFGGACMMLGDDLMMEQADDEQQEENEQDGDMAAKEKQRLGQAYQSEKAFANKPVWSRIAIIAAGPVFNFLLAFVLAVVIIASTGTDPCTIDAVDEGSPAQEAGLEPGDCIVKINGNGIAFAREYSFYEYYHAADTMNITYVRDGKKYHATVEPAYQKNQAYRLGITISNNSLVNEVMPGSPAEEGGIQPNDIILSVGGIALSDSVPISDALNASGGAPTKVVVSRQGEELELTVTPQLAESEGYYTGFACYGTMVRVSPAATVLNAAKEVGYWIETVVKSLGMMFTGQLGINDLSGPVGIVDVVNTVVEESKPAGAWVVIINLLSFMVMISANLGVMNLLPLPALDGGRLMFMLIEVVRGKPVQKEREGMVHFVGMVLLMILMVYILFKDIHGLF